jgi:hypothetical protein
MFAHVYVSARGGGFPREAKQDRLRQGAEAEKEVGSVFPPHPNVEVVGCTLSITPVRLRLFLSFSYGMVHIGLALCVSLCVWRSRMDGFEVVAAD